MRARPLLIVCLLASPALAVRPPEGAPLGLAFPNTAEGPVVHRPDPVADAALLGSAPWQTFTQGEGRGWTARATSSLTPLRAYGPPIAVGQPRTASEADATLAPFLTRHAELLGLGGATVQLRGFHRADGPTGPQGDTYVDYTVYRDGLPVLGAELTFRLRGGSLVLFGAATFPNAPVVGALTLSADQALAAARRHGPAPLAAHRDRSATPYLVPWRHHGKLTLRPVWQVRSTTQTPVGRWSTLIDATTGELLDFHNDVRFFDGQLSAEHDVRIADGTFDTAALAFATLTASDGTEVLTDATGAFSLPDTGEPFTLTLDGPRVRMNDDLGDVQPALTDAFATLTAADFSERQAALTTWHWLQRAQDHAALLDPENDWVTSRVTATVNVDDVCNAYFDGEVHFFRSGSGCNNTGRLADVIAHEWGHGFHAYGIEVGEFDGSLGEGAADTFAFLLSDDPRIAPNFFTSSGAELRNVDNNTRFPDDFRAGEVYVHSNGLIFGASMWDTREALRASVGEPDASLTLGRIFARMLRAGPSIPTAYEEALFADDDDNDLSNGTPHQCELVAGFGAHGLGPAGGQGLRPTVTPLADALPDTPVDLTVRLESPAPDCFAIDTAEAVVHYAVGDGPWQTTPLAIDGADATGAIPGQPLGAVVTWWVELTDAAGTTYADPPGGEIRPHTYVVGELLEIACADLEADNGGFLHELVDGTVTEGADDWQRGEPLGLSGDPVGAFSGEHVWGNDLGGDDYNGAYQDGKTNRLYSQAYDTLHYQGVLLQYRRWLTVEDGVFDQATIFADDVEVWTNYATSTERGTAHHLDDAWALHSVPLRGEGDDGSVTVAWQIASDQGLYFGGWNLDDICLYAPATPDNRLGIGDLRATTADGDLTLTFTHPRHAPVTEVVVVHKRSGLPTGPTDGEVVERFTNPEPGSPATVTLKQRPGGYAVYGTDGTDWLSWTRIGRNAVEVDGKGCGCDTPGGGSWVLVGLIGLVGRRRRTS